MTNWYELTVTDAYGNNGETLGSMLTCCPASLDNATISNGKITEWPGFLLSAPGEDPDWDTPRGDVDWRGFRFHFDCARGDLSTQEVMDEAQAGFVDRNPQFA